MESPLHSGIVRQLENDLNALWVIGMWLRRKAFGLALLLLLQRLQCKEGAGAMGVHRAALAALPLHVGGRASPKQDKQLQSDRKTLLQALLLHTASIQESTAASPALSLLSPAAVSPLLAFAAVLPPPSSSSSPVPPSSCAPFPGLHVRMPDTPRPAVASGLGFGFSLPYKCEQGVVRAGRPLSESRAG